MSRRASPPVHFASPAQLRRSCTCAFTHRKENIVTTYRELQAQIERLQAQAESVRLEEKRAAVSRIREEIARYDLTPRDLFGDRPRRPRRSPRRGVVQPKYRDPQTGATWSGRGREPLWITGRSREQFLIGPSS
ncbi:H-NS histone family protein [Burkholderia stagnalis]|uniref:H-NS histone family protein n=1 Tax=Burkholderia stagnalis TaxID=1503054 RepID=A0A3P0DUD1_9BURK|nr:H-NS histone family protein [Burkholderia stagnalis]RQQ15946.1 H-NS histone family protein [Burkholderia stagnalis]RQQ18964.1 H-NS histone family protein [Burkholderia stagnalis]RQQ34722.1 H-NS histone family protein [Burkholderia stagnalis]RQQ38477.1 H-NS histone family protein [Burkholderia stagnalis]